MKKLSRILLLFIALFLLKPDAGFSQFYQALTKNRPATINWKEINTPHFRIIFPARYDSLARRAAAILETEYPQAKALTGGSLEHFPVVLNPFNDLSNGFVATLNFRSEVVLAPFTDKEMNPRSGDWLETVLPHELVHANHFNVQQPLGEKKFSIPNLISVFSPDMARSFHAFAPVGVHEGLATHYESSYVFPGGGRGNYTHFNNRFNVNFNSSDRWNMGQTFIPSVYTHPYNRHYIAGYRFTDWLQQRYGDKTSAHTIRYHYSYFFLGYGYALKQVTGKWPWELYDEYTSDLKVEEEQRLSEVGTLELAEGQLQPALYKGARWRRPYWLNNKELIAYGSFYNGKPGFYIYNKHTEAYRLLSESFAVGGLNYYLNASEQKLLTGEYKRDPLYAGVYRADLMRINTESGSGERITWNKRVYAPAVSGDRMMAIQNSGAGARIVSVSERGETEVIFEADGVRPVSLQVNPVNNEQLAVLMNRRGVQALWFTTIKDLKKDLRGEPDLAFSGASVHDPSWHPSGTRLLFTLDRSPAMNTYEYHISEDRVYQLTNSRYNISEASWSPDGETLAFVRQTEGEQLLALASRSELLNLAVDAGEQLKNNELAEAINRPLLGNEMLSDSTWEIRDYKTGFSWLKPRMVLPVIKEKSGVTEGGVAFSSGDVLSSQAYRFELTGIQDRLWYNLSYTNKSFYPGFKAEWYSEPDFLSATDPETERSVGILRQERGLELGLPFDYTFRSDTRLSSLTFEPSIAMEQIKYYNLIPQPVSGFASRYKAGLFSQINLGLQRLPRDVQPSGGLVAFSFLETTLNEPENTIKYPSGAEGRVNFSNQWSAYYGLFGYVSVVRKWNQSLKLDLRFLKQSAAPVFSTSTIIPPGFSENPFPTFAGEEVNNNLARFSSRYVIPLWYPDKGGLTVPFYLSSMYISAFSHSLTNLNGGDLLKQSRTIAGVGLHFQFKVSNLNFELGFGVAFEPTRNQTQLIIGQF